MLPQFGYRTQRLLSWTIPVTALTLILTFATPSSAQVAPADRLCDNAFEDCRATILQMIRNETAGIDVSYWFMTDWRYSGEIIKRWQAGVPVRILLDLRADPGYPAGVLHPAIVHQRRDTDPPEGHDRHQSLEDDAVQGAERRPLQRRELRERLVLAVGSGRGIPQVRGRGDLFHDRSDRRPDVHEEVRRHLDEYHALRQPREHLGSADAETTRRIREISWIPS